MWHDFGPCTRNHGLTLPPTLDGCGIYTSAVLGGKSCGGCGCPINFHIHQTVRDGEIDGRGEERNIRDRSPAKTGHMKSQECAVQEDVDDSKQHSESLVTCQVQQTKVTSDSPTQVVEGVAPKPPENPECSKLNVPEGHVTTSIDHGSPRTAANYLVADKSSQEQDNNRNLQASDIVYASPEVVPEVRYRAVIEPLDKEQKETSSLLQMSGTF